MATGALPRSRGRRGWRSVSRCILANIVNQENRHGHMVANYARGAVSNSPRMAFSNSPVPRTRDKSSSPCQALLLPPVQQLEKLRQPNDLDIIAAEQKRPRHRSGGAHDGGRGNAPWQARLLGREHWASAPGMRRDQGREGAQLVTNWAGGTGIENIDRFIAPPALSPCWSTAFWILLMDGQDLGDAQSCRVSRFFYYKLSTRRGTRPARRPQLPELCYMRVLFPSPQACSDLSLQTNSSRET